MRIASLVPSLTLAMDRLGRTDDLVGVTRFCIHPEARLKDVPRVGGTKDPDLSMLRDLAPDLILANSDEQRAETLRDLERLAAETGSRLLVTETDSIDEVAETWTTLGDAVDRPGPAADERARIEQARDDAQAGAEARQRLATLVPVWKDPWMASGGGTYITDLVGACGFDNILEDTSEKWARFVPSTDPTVAGTVAQGPAAGTSIHALPRVPEAVLLPTEPYAFADGHRGLFTDLGVPREQVRVVDGELMTWWLTHTAAALFSFEALHAELADVVHAT